MIKVNNDKIEIITTVSKSETDLSMKLTKLSDKFECAFSNQHSQVASMITRLEKVEGKSSSFNFPNYSIPQLDSQGVLQTNLSATSGTSIEIPVYGNKLIFIWDGHHCQISLLRSDRPHGQSDRTVWPDDGCFEKPTPVNRADLSAIMQSQLAAMSDFSKFF
jgi:hypothetical protein